MCAANSGFFARERGGADGGKERDVPKQFMRIRDLGHAGALAVLDRARRIRRSPAASPVLSPASASGPAPEASPERFPESATQAASQPPRCLAGKTAALVFETVDESSLALFETAVRRLGGTPRRVASVEIRSDGLETPEEIALSHGADILIFRACSRSRFERLAADSGVSVLNAGDEAGDPGRVLADLLHVLEREGDFARTRVAWIGEANGVASSWIEAAIYFPFELFMAVPPGREPDRALLGLALQAGAKIFLTYEPHMAIQGAGYVCINDAGGGAPVLTPELAALAAPGAVLLDGRAPGRPEGVSEGDAAGDSLYGLSPAPDRDESRLCLIEALLEWLAA